MRTQVRVLPYLCGVALALVALGRSAGAQNQAAQDLTLVWEAEEATTSLPPIVAAGAEGASGGQCVHVSGEYKWTTGSLRYVVRVPRADTYYPWFRLRGGRRLGWGRFSVDGQPAGPYVVGDPARARDEWHWYASPDEAAEPPVSRTLDLTAGDHVLALAFSGEYLGPYAGDQPELDMVLLTTDPAYVPGGDGLRPVASTPGVVQPQPEPDALLAWEAEDFTSMTPPVEVAPLPGDEAVACITVPNDVSTRAGAVSYRMAIPRDGEYYLWVRVAAGHWDGWGQFEVDGEPAGPAIGPWETPLRWWRYEPASWTEAARLAGPERHLPLSLTAGEHTLALGPPGICADGIARFCGKLDAFVLTTDPGYVPGGDGLRPVPPTPRLVARQQEPGVLLVWDADDTAEELPSLSVSQLGGAFRGEVVSAVGEQGTLPAYRVRIPTAGTYYLWARTYYDNGGARSTGPEVHVRVAGHEVVVGHTTAGGGPYWAWVQYAPVVPVRNRPIASRAVPAGLELPAGDVEVTVTALGRGTSVDQFALVDDPYWVPGGDGRPPLEPTTSVTVP